MITTFWSKILKKKRKFCEAIFGRICLPKLNTNPEMAITKKADHYLGWILWSDYDFTQYVFSLSPFMQPCKCFIGLVSCFWFNRIFWPKENFNNQLFKNIFSQKSNVIFPKGITPWNIINVLLNMHRNRIGFKFWV